MELAPNLQHIISSQTLKWIFVGGKGGVGKTTTSSSLACALAQSRESVLIISTDPAHNLSDAFDQKFGSEPTQVAGIPNLYAMEIVPKVDMNQVIFPDFMGTPDEASRNFIGELITTVPGIDEAMSFGELMKSVQNMQFQTIVFDTAPTGHTLKLLNFPQILDKGLSKIVQLKETIGPMLAQMSNMLGITDENLFETIFSRLGAIKSIVERVIEQFKDETQTTFIAVCIPEFLSLYETERLVQEIFRFEMNIENIIINQVVFPEDQCKKCNARRRMQEKYLKQFRELYDDFHLVITPLLDEEVRGVENLQAFSRLLLQID